MTTDRTVSGERLLTLLTLGTERTVSAEFLLGQRLAVQRRKAGAGLEDMADLRGRTRSAVG